MYSEILMYEREKGMGNGIGMTREMGNDHVTERMEEDGETEG